MSCGRRQSSRRCDPDEAGGGAGRFLARCQGKQTASCVAPRELAHDKLAHDKLAHDELAHDKLAHDKLAHDELAHDKLALTRRQETRASALSQGDKAAGDLCGMGRMRERYVENLRGWRGRWPAAVL